MIVCRECGNQNEDGDQFCGSCSSFLEWSGERAQELHAVAEPVAAVVVPDDTRPGLVARVRHAIGATHEPQTSVEPLTAAPPAGSAPTPAAPEAVGSEVTLEGSAAAEPTRRPPISGVGVPVVGRQAPRDVARPLDRSGVPATTVTGAPASGPRFALAPGAAPPSGEPGAIQPAAEHTGAAPVVHAASRRPRRPGDLICGACGAGNDPTRRFCRDCGQSLVEATVLHIPWYRRMLGRWRRLPVAAGTRTARMRARATHGGVSPVGVAVRRWTKRLVPAVVAAVVALVVLVPSARSTVQGWARDLREHFAPTLVQVRPADATGPALPGHPATLAVDGATNTWWSADTRTDAQPAIRVTFAVPVNIARVIIWPGQPDAVAGQFTQHPRPAAIHLTFSDGSTRDVTLADQHQPQVFEVTTHEVVWADLRITSIRPSLGNQAHDVSISEVEFDANQ